MGTFFNITYYKSVDLIMADVAKPEQTTEVSASADAKEPEKVAENNATPPETEKAQEKTDSPVVNGDAPAQADKKEETTPESAAGASEKSKQSNFFSKIKKQMSFKNINILKKKKSPKEPIEEKSEQPAVDSAKEEDKSKEDKAVDDKTTEKSPEESTDKKRNKGRRFGKLS